MPVRVIVPPAPVVALEEARRHLRVETGEDDLLITGLVAAAQGHIDGPDGWLGRAVGLQTLEWTAAGFLCGRNFRLPFPPLVAASVSVKYSDSAGVEQTVDAAAYRVFDNRIWFVSGYSFPATISRPDALRVRYDAGYDGVPQADGGTGDVPAAILAAILLHVGALYENREETAIGVTVEAIPEHVGVRALLAPYRIWSV